MWLRLTGRVSVKPFIREEVSGLLGDAINWESKEACYQCVLARINEICDELNRILVRQD